MARLQFSTALRNLRINLVEATVDNSPKLRLFSGAIPINIAAVDTGILLCEMQLPNNFLSGGSNGIVAKSGVWSGVADAEGIATYFRLINSDDGLPHVQGDVGLSGDVSMILNEVNITEGMTVTVTTFSLTEANG